MSEPFKAVAGQLSRLENANLIRVAAAQPELEYIFRHALIQESAYHSLVRADRRRVHRAAGQALEALYAGNNQPLELSLQLGRHFEEATDDARAIQYYALAGDAALALFANAEAVSAYTRALACAERSSTEPETWQHLFSYRGRALELQSQFQEALANYQAMARRGEAQGQRRLALTAAIAIGQLYATTTPLFDPPRAERMSEAALAEAQALGDESAESKILWNQLNLYRNTQRNQQARACGERSLEIAQRLNLKEQAALDLNDLTHVYADLALWPKMRQASEDAGRLWRELGNTAMLADSLATAALNNNVLGDFKTAISQAEEAQRLSVTIGNLWGQAYSFSGMSWAYWFTGQPGRAIELNEACIRIGRLAGYLAVEVLDQARLGYMIGELGDTERALEVLRQAAGWTKYFDGIGLATILSIRVHLELRSANVEQAAATLREMETSLKAPAIWEVDSILRSRSEVALAQGDAARALDITQAHVDRLREFGLLAYLPEALAGLAQALLGLGRVAEAREQLVEALDRVQQLGAPVIEWRVLYALGNLETQYGNPADAERYWATALAIVTAFAAKIPTAQWRASFLARPDVRALRGEAPLTVDENKQRAL